jgi:parallel beta-helix repeat protein
MFQKSFSKFTILLVACVLVIGLGRLTPVEAAAKTYYVAPTGKDTNPGTEALPFLTMQKAVNVMQPGDTTLVKNGTYSKYADSGAFVRFTRSGTASAWITLKAYPGHKPKIVSPVWNAILFERVSYIEVSGFAVQGVASTISKYNANGIIANYSHHIIIRNNDVYNMPGGGIGSGYSDYLTVESNKVHNTSKRSTYATSAISMYQLTNIDSWSGYHNIIRGNIVWDNANVVGKITDGNCIIIDRSRHPDANNNPVNPYTGRTLIENNVCFNNGGRGIHIYRSDYAFVTNNTLYMNQYTKGMDGSELSALYSGNSEFYNNIVYTRPGKIANNAWQANNIKWGRNLYFNAKAVTPKASNDIVGVNPQFVLPSTSPTVANFRLKPTSPAINKHVGAYVPPKDLDLNARPFGGVSDLGAFENMTVNAQSAVALPADAMAVQSTQSLMVEGDPAAAVIAPEVEATAELITLEAEVTAEPMIVPDGSSLLVAIQPAHALVGETVNVNLQLAAVSDVYGMEVKCVVDPTILTGVARTDGTIFNAGNSFFVDSGFQADGSWSSAASLLKPAPAFSGDGVAFTLGYTVANAGSTDVTCTATIVDQNGRPLDMTVVNNTFSVDVPVVEATPIVTEEPVIVEPPVEMTEPPLETGFDPESLETPPVEPGEIIPEVTEVPVEAVPTEEVIPLATITGLASYQNSTTQAGITVRLLSGETALAELVTNEGGDFTFTDVPDGEYTLQVSAPKSLTLVTAVSVVGGQTNALPELSLLAGDADSSGLIDLSDAALIGANFQLVVPPAPTEADLNGDSTIDVGDLVLVGSNFGQAGPVTVAQE